MDQIILMNAARKQVGQLVLRQNGAIEILVSNAFAELAEDLHRLGETISKTDLYRQESVTEKDVIIRVQEKIESGQKGYINAIAAFINSQAGLVKPRVFAVVSAKK